MKPTRIPNTFRILSVLLSVTAAHGAVVVADFNDNTLGLLSSQTPGEGQAGGSGWDPDPNNTWGNTGTINVISGDLSAPGSTNYAITQSGDGKSIQGVFDDNRQTTRVTATTLAGGGGTVWFSLLLRQSSTESRTGLSVNQNTSSPFNGRILVVVGSEVRIGLESLVASSPSNPTITVGTDNLFVGRLIVNPSGNQSLSLWVNPDVSGGIAGLGSADATRSEESASIGAGISRIGLLSYSTAGNTNDGGIMDSIRFSDNADANQAFADVTGVLIPEPSASLLGMFSLGLLALRRKR